MAREIIPSLHVVGLSVLLATLGAQPTIASPELFVLLRRCGLRGGAIPWKHILALARSMKLIVLEGDGVRLSAAGRTLRALTGSDLEPTDDFERALVLCCLGRSSARVSLSGLEINGQRIRKTRLAADAVLEQLRDVGVVQPTASSGEWSITSDLWAPVLTGLLLSARRAEAANTVGRIGEALTLRYLEDQGCNTLHLSPIADVFGFDILGYRCLGHSSLAVEAKATTTVTAPAFFLSRNELRVAKSVGARYWVIVWPGVDDSLSIDHNYRLAMTRGGPRILRDPHALIAMRLPLFISGASITEGSIRADGLIWTLP